MQWSLRTVLWAALAVLLALAAALTVALRNGPSGRLVLAVGGADGAYQALAKTYRADLERSGVTLVLRDDLTGPDILKAIQDPASGVHGGLFKGGYLGSLTGRTADAREMEDHEKDASASRSLGRVMLEPVWVFTRGDLPIRTLRDLAGKRILIGLARSGARRVAMQLLRANGIGRDSATFIDKDLSADAAALFNGEADAAIMILPPESERIQRLLRVDNIRLMDFSPEAQAYTSRFPALTSVVMVRSAVEFTPLIPSADITLLATTTALIVRRDLHPALVSLLTHAVTHNPKSAFDKAGDQVLFHKAGQFPSSDDPEFEVAPEARALYKSGDMPVVLRASAPMVRDLGLPFALTAFIGAHGVPLALVLIPALTILLPMLSVAPTVYRWSIRQRLLRWYAELRALERRLDYGPAGVNGESLLAEIDRIDAAARAIKVPLEFSDEHYELRMHIELVRQRLRLLSEPAVG